MAIKRRQVNLPHKLLRSLIPVQIFAIGINTISSMITTVIVGHMIGASGLAAIAFIFPFTMIINMIGQMISIGSQTLCGYALGRGNREELNTIFTLNILLCLVFGVLMMAATIVAAGPLAQLFGASGETTAITADYLRGIGMGAVPMIFSFSLLMFFQLDHVPKISYTATTLLISVTAVFEIISVKFLHMGMFGVGLSVSLGYLAMTIVGILYYLLGGCGFRLSGHAFDWKKTLQIFRTGLPIGALRLTVTIRAIIMNHLIMSVGGTIAVSCYGVFCNVNTLMYVFIDGIGGANSILASVLAGERDKKGIRDLTDYSYKLTLFCGVLLVICNLLFAKPMAILFGVAPEHLEYAARIIIIGDLCLITDCINFTTTSIYQGLNNTRFVTTFHILSCGVVFLCFVFPLSYLFGMDGIMATFPVGTTTMALLIILYTWKKTKKRPRSFTDLIIIPESVSVRPEDSLYFAVDKKEEVTEVALLVEAFCRQKQMESRTVYLTSLCIEEMVGNVIDHGFRKSRRRAVVEVRLICEKDQISILIRDNCVPFNPVERAAIYNPEDPFRNVGIKMVQKLATEMNYQSTLGLNVLSITI